MPLLLPKWITACPKNIILLTRLILWQVEKKKPFMVNTVFQNRRQVDALQGSFFTAFTFDVWFTLIFSQWLLDDSLGATLWVRLKSHSQALGGNENAAFISSVKLWLMKYFSPLIVDTHCCVVDWDPNCTRCVAMMLEVEACQWMQISPY